MKKISSVHTPVNRDRTPATTATTALRGGLAGDGDKLADGGLWGDDSDEDGREDSERDVDVDVELVVVLV